MYNLLIGPPGGGKSYEAVVYHVLPTLESGRKVITNLPLNVAEFAKIDARFPSLIELRTKPKGQSSPHVFGNIEDYGDDWRHPETGQGPLYAIDECHKPLRRGRTLIAVEEWYAEHRHEGADVLLMTQSYGKVSKDITDSAQVVYRVKKMTAFGDDTRYIRKVQDGVRGDVLSTSERTYESRYFRLYKSHTRSVAAVLEADARDISPAFKKWLRAGYAVIGLGTAALAFKGYAAFTSDEEPKATAAAVRSGAPSTASAGAVASMSPLPVVPQAVHSTDKRLVGVVLAGQYSHALIHTKNGDYRAPLVGCIKDSLSGWSCEIAGEIITERTGPNPAADVPSGFLGVGGLLQPG